MSTPGPASGPEPARGLDRGPATSPAPRRAAGFPMRERSSMATVLGVPPLVAFGLGAGGTALGVLIDILRIGTVGSVFTALHFVGCVLAVVWVRRRSLFGPMVAPPLLVAAAVPAVVLLAAPPRPGSGITEQLIAVGAPLVNSFPTMATTTAVVVAGGVLRIVAQPLPGEPGLIARLRPRPGGRRGNGDVRPGPGARRGSRDVRLDPSERSERRGSGDVRQSPASDAARAAGRTSASPERS